jgi:hypothetical protein
MNLNEFFINEDPSRLSIGDPVTITGRVQFNGETGDVKGFNQDGSFVIVDLYNHGPRSFHISDVGYNDYAGSDQEYDDNNWPDDRAMAENITASSPVVYHGNQGGIHGELKTPMWWTASKKDAIQFATQGNADGWVYSARLSCKNPYIIKSTDETNTVLSKYKQLLKQGYDSIYDSSVGDWIPFYAKDIHVIGEPEYYEGQQDVAEGNTSPQWTRQLARQFTGQQAPNINTKTQKNTSPQWTKKLAGQFAGKKDTDVAEGGGNPDIQPGTKTQYGTVVRVNGNTVTVRASNGDLTNVNIHDIQQGVAEGYPKHQDLSGISTDKLKAYLDKQSKQQVSGEGNQVKRVRAELQRRQQGVAEGSNDTIYPNAEVIKSKNGKPVGEIYQDGNSWGCFHYRADRGYDFIDSREEAIEALKDLHQETGRSRPDYTVKGVAEDIVDKLVDKMSSAAEKFSKTKVARKSDDLMNRFVDKLSDVANGSKSTKPKQTKGNPPKQGVAEDALDEISQDTARSYVQKARASQKDLINQTYRKGADTDKLNKKIQNRQRGMNRAHTDKRYYKDELGLEEGWKEGVGYTVLAGLLSLGAINKVSDVVNAAVTGEPTKVLSNWNHKINNVNAIKTTTGQGIESIKSLPSAGDKKFEMTLNDGRKVRFTTTDLERAKKIAAARQASEPVEVKEQGLAESKDACHVCGQTPCNCTHLAEGWGADDVTRYDNGYTVWTRTQTARAGEPRYWLYRTPAGVASDAAAADAVKSQQPVGKFVDLKSALAAMKSTVAEGRVKELVVDLKDSAMSNEDFKKKYGKTREEIRAAFKQSQSKRNQQPVDEVSQKTVKDYMAPAVKGALAGEKSNQRQAGLARAVARLSGTDRPIMDPAKQYFKESRAAKRALIQQIISKKP